MREKKFRAWDNEHSRMLGPFSLSDLSYKSDCGIINLKNWDDLVKVDDLEWVQFTGLKDKNGKEIYEGDIVETKYGTIHSIEWRDGAFIYSPSKTDKVGGYFLLCEFSSEEDEVIGNIYENKELLK